MALIEITEENFSAAVDQADKPVLLDFWAEWCPPCRMLSPLVDEIANERDDIVVGKVNVDEQPALAARFQVSSIPTLIVRKNGQTAREAVGGRSKEEILALLD